MSQPHQPFLETLYHLRTVEHIILYNKRTAIPHKEEQDVIDFLEGEYERECLDYPFTAPSFSPKAALWGAKIIYTTAQLFLFRDDKETELLSIIPYYENTIDSSAMLSADLCLRFLPSVKFALEAADANDPLIAIVEKHLEHFPYSGIGRDGDFSEPDTSVVRTNNCLNQLYLDRVAERKAVKWATGAVVKSEILANMGNYQQELWREFK